jgi:hypothetical protein
MGLRELILLAIVVLAGYVGYQLYRVSRVGTGRSSTGPAVPAPPAATDAAAENGSEDDDYVVFDRPAVPIATTPVPADAAPRPEVFQLELEVRQLRRDIAQQRTELAELRRLIDELGDTVRAQKEQVEASLTSHGASPEYNEALVFARRGLDVEAIAERCGITVAEAELVRSLARSGSGDAGKAS